MRDGTEVLDRVTAYECKTCGFEGDVDVSVSGSFEFGTCPRCKNDFEREVWSW